MDTSPYSIAAILIKRFNEIPIDVQEKQVLDLWLQQPKNQNLYNELLADPKVTDLLWLTRIDEEKAWASVMEKQHIKKITWKTWAAVAAVLVCVLTGGLLFYTSTSDPLVENRYVKSEILKYENDVLPADLGAKILLGNGEFLSVNDTLDVASNSLLMAANASNMESEKEELQLNTLVVPSAKFFKLVLVDGTTVWVNAGSELRFPSQFAHSERRVQLKGEAYFEVQQDTKRPFYVETEDLTVRVLGTHFNVSAYKQNSKTTLAEGSVEVHKNAKSVVIAPGQSAEWSRGDLRVKQADLLRDLAWKNNVFYFKEDNIVNIAQQLKQWYDLEISFSDNVSLTKTYSGEVRRDVKLSEVLNMLEFVSDLDFKLSKNKLLIIKK